MVTPHPESCLSLKGKLELSIWLPVWQGLASNNKLGNSRPCESQVRIRVWDEIVQVARFGETSPIRYVNFGAGRPVQLYVRPGKPACPQNPACP